MVNEPRINVKSDFFNADLQTLYYSMCELVREHKYGLYMACCIVETAVEYILYGTYSRKEVIDARIIGYHNGVPEIEKQIIHQFKVQRLRHKDCGHTHALMFEWFIPYQKYSIRFVLLHLQRYFSLKTSMEKYCLENEIPISTFRRWKKWLKENMGLLTETGIVLDKEENRKNLMSWLLEISDNTRSWLLRSLSGLNRVLFQWRGMPADYVNYRILLFRHL